MKERKLFNLKSHDCYILIQDLPSLALRAVKGNNLVDFLCELSDLFKELCAKELNVDKLDEPQKCGSHVMSYGENVPN